MLNYRKPLHDKLIADFKLLNFTGTSTKCFANVKKHYFEIPATSPSCRIIPISPSVQIEGNTMDTRVLGFQIDVFELLEASASEEEAEKKIDRLSNIEDIILAYIQKLPNNLEYAVTGVHVYEMVAQAGFYSYEGMEQGIAVYLTIPVDLRIDITPQLL